MFLSRLDQQTIQRLLAQMQQTGRTQATPDDFLAAQDDSWRGLARCRERDECRHKLVRLGFLEEEEDEPDDE
jgi:thymidylate synthase (FAD)